MTMISLIAALETCEYELICITLHSLNEEKSTDTIERLKASNVEKCTLDGKKFHTFTVLSAKYLYRDFKLRQFRNKFSFECFSIKKHPFT